MRGRAGLKHFVDSRATSFKHRSITAYLAGRIVYGLAELL